MSEKDLQNKGFLGSFSLYMHATFHDHRLLIDSSSGTDSQCLILQNQTLSLFALGAAENIYLDSVLPLNLIKLSKM